MATNSAQISVATGAASLLWQTSTGVSPDPLPASAGGTAQVFRAASFNDPLTITVINTDATNPIYIGGSGVTSGTGTRLAAGLSRTWQVVGNDSAYAISTGGTVVTGVSVNRQ
jgi:hypothetical protein